MKPHQIDSGTAWVRRWFAKPVATGSIPATVSKRFPVDYTRAEMADLVIEHRNSAIAARTALSETREKLIAAQKELSAMRRKSQAPVDDLRKEA